MKKNVKLKNGITMIIAFIQLVLSLWILSMAINTGSFSIGILALIISYPDIEVD